MGRRLTQQELVTHLRQAVVDLREQLDQPLESMAVVGTEAYADQFVQRHMNP